VHSINKGIALREFHGAYNLRKNNDDCLMLHVFVFIHALVNLRIPLWARVRLQKDVYMLHVLYQCHLTI